jgi:N-acetylmuramoyl-L-alanine amidase
MDYIKRKIILAAGVLIVIALVFGAHTPVRASAGAAEHYQSANRAYVDLCRSASKRKARNTWLKVIHQYVEVYKQYPTSRFAPTAQFRTAKLYEQLYGYSGKSGDLRTAAQAYLGVAKNYPSSKLADDAIYRAARINARLGKKDTAYSLYSRVISQYPKGDMKQLAREGMNSIKVARKSYKGSSRLSQVKKIRQWSNKDYTRVVIDLEKDVPFSTMTLGPDKKSGRPNRLVIDLKNTRTPPGLSYKTDVHDGILSDIRVAQFRKDKVRVVLDLSQKSYYDAFALQNPPRLVIDVSKNKGSIKKIASYQSTVKKVRTHSPSKMPDNVPSIASQFALKVSRIVIDPGHGGKDPGALSRSGIKEKNITLTIGKLLARRLKQEGFVVYLTRTTDKFLTLEERTAFANKQKADLFISLHVNSNVDRSVRGIETYFLNLTTDASAIEVAARENATTSKSISDLQLIINDLMLNSKINESSKFATSVHKYVMSSATKVGYRGRNLGVRQAPFYVLLGAQMPSILIELGFVTNSTDCSLLRRKSYQNTLIDGIAKGINNYIMNTTYAYRGRTR